MIKEDAGTAACNCAGSQAPHGPLESQNSRNLPTPRAANGHFGIWSLLTQLLVHYIQNVIKSQKSRKHVKLLIGVRGDLQSAQVWLRVNETLQDVATGTVATNMNKYGKGWKCLQYIICVAANQSLLWICYSAKASAFKCKRDFKWLQMTPNSYTCSLQELDLHFSISYHHGYHT